MNLEYRNKLYKVRNILVIEVKGFSRGEYILLK
jgi:hypothetical protein